MQILFKKCFRIAVVVTGMFVSGCVSFITPHLGSVAEEDSILKIDSLGVEQKEWKTDDLQLNFSALKTGNNIELTGDLIFNAMVTNTYNKIRTFNVKMSFVDNQNKVLSAMDITPMLPAYGLAPDKVKFQVQTQVPQGAEAIVFNYYGVFFGDEGRLGETEVFHFPFS